MQVTCPQCTTRLQLSAPKLPNHPFTIKCPKCQHGITVAPPEAPPPPENLFDSDPLDLGATEGVDRHTPVEPVAAVPPAPVPPPVPHVAPSVAAASTPPPPAARVANEIPSVDPNLAIGWTNSMPSPTVADDNTLFTGQGAQQDLLQALAALFASNGLAKPTARLEARRRRGVVVCLANPEDVQIVEHALPRHDYEITVAASPEQVTSMLQSSHHLDILLLDPNFHAGQQGGATIMRYLNMLNPARRRRVFVVVISHTYRTLDMHAAFAHGVNLVINSNELESLPQALAKSIGDFNDLYRAFNQVSGISSF